MLSAWLLSVGSSNERKRMGHWNRGMTKYMGMENICLMFHVTWKLDHPI